jgi:hypothetical protein
LVALVRDHDEVDVPKERHDVVTAAVLATVMRGDEDVCLEQCALECGVLE